MSSRRSRVVPVTLTPARPSNDSPLVGKVRTYISDLVEPWTEIHTQPATHEARARTVKIQHASLLEQLDGSVGSSVGVASSSAQSKPPVATEPLSLAGEIHEGVDLWARRLLAPAFRSGVEAAAGSRLRQTCVLLMVIGRRAHAIEPHHLESLTGDVLTWWAHARVVTTWDSAPIKPHVPCVECGVVGKVRVSTEEVGVSGVLRVSSAVCLECRAAWDRESIGVLGQQIEMMLDLARPKVDVVAAHVDRGARGAGRAGPWNTPTSADSLVGVGPDRPWSDQPPHVLDGAVVDQ